MPDRPPILLALGGGGFSMEPENPLLDAFTLELAACDAPRVAFLPTASGDRAAYVEDFHAAFVALGARTSHVLLPWSTEPDAGPEAGRPEGTPTPADPLAHLAAQDVVYVGGGNTRRMLAVWRAYGLVPLLRERWTTGRAVLAGVSAGALCWFESGVTDSVPGRLTPMQGLGWLAGSFCPHYDGEVGRRPSYEALVSAGELPAGIAADDGCGLLYEGTRLTRVVSSRPEAAAWRVAPAEGVATSVPLPAEYLAERS